MPSVNLKFLLTFRVNPLTLHLMPPGRPKGKKLSSRNTSLATRLTPALRASLEKEANARGSTLSGLCYSILKAWSGSHAEAPMPDVSMENL